METPTAPLPVPTLPALRSALDQRVVLAPPALPEDHAPLTRVCVPCRANDDRLHRATKLLRRRLNWLESPSDSLPPARKRVLSHQAERLARIVYALVLISKAYDEAHRQDHHRLIAELHSLDSPAA